ncbi:MAG: MATE family efflux transporter [Christensenellales bacterium]
MAREKRVMQNAITEGVIWKQLLLFFFPIVLGTFFQQLYNTADAIIVGKFVGKEALAAVGGTTGTLINLLVGFFVGLSSGASVIISQFYGAQRSEDVSRAVHTTMALALASGAALTVLGICLSKNVLIMMGTPADVLDYAVTYINIYFLGMIPSLIYNIGSGILRAVGDSRRPLFSRRATMTNIVLDVVLVIGLNLGVAGAAAATVLSQVVSAVLVMMTLCRTSQVYRLQLKKIRFYGDMLVRIVRIGLPAGLQSVMYSLSNIIIQASVNGFGTDVMAAYTAYGKVDGMYWMVINAFGVAITTFVGQNFGARLYDRMKKSINVCLGISAAVTIALSAVLLAIAKPMLGLFSDDAQVIEIGLSIVYLIVPTYITYLFIEILSGAMRGAGDSLIPTIMTLTGVCLLRVFWVTVVVSAHHELKVLLMSYPITWIVTSAMFLVYYLRGKWLKRCIALQNAEN